MIPGFAVGPEDDLYTNVRINNGGAQVFLRLNSAGEYLSEPESFLEGGATAAAVDLSNNELYIDNLTTVLAVNASEGVGGAQIERFGSEHLSHGTGVAVNSSTGNALSNSVYVADGIADRVDVFNYVLIPDVATEPASNVKEEAGHGTVSATLNGKVDPNGLPVTSCEFEYGTSTSYGSRGECSTNPGSGSAEVPVSADLTGLLPDTTYHFRLRAANRNDESEQPNPGTDETFSTPGPGIEETSISDVASTSATLNATIDPNKALTTYHFEYDTREYKEGEGPHGVSVPVPDVSIGSGEAPVRVPEHVLQGLAASTLYHYRVVAVSELEVGGGTKAVTFDGPDQTFTTQHSGGEFVLPDGRRYEMVTPPQKEGASVLRSRSFLRRI